MPIAGDSGKVLKMRTAALGATSALARGGKTLQRYRRPFTVPRTGVMKDNSMRYRASKRDCEVCPLKPRCCPNTPARKIPRSIHEGARDLARDIAKTEAYQVSRCQRKKVEMLFAHLKRILKIDRLRLRGPNGARDEFHLAATAQNLRKLAKLIPVTRQTRQPEVTPSSLPAQTRAVALRDDLKNRLFHQNPNRQQTLRPGDGSYRSCP